MCLRCPPQSPSASESTRGPGKARFIGGDQRRELKLPQRKAAPLRQANGGELDRNYFQDGRKLVGSRREIRRRHIAGNQGKSAQVEDVLGQSAIQVTCCRLAGENDRAKFRS